jgi:arylformamidase
MLDNYDAQFRVRALVPDFDSYLDRYRALSAETRRLVRHSLDCAYGSSSLERLDVFLPQAEGNRRAVHVFFHGGYWRAFDKSEYSFVARPITDTNAVAVIANYGLMPAVTMADLVEQCRSAIRWVRNNAVRFGGDPGRISVSGHSAGGHIASLLHLMPWENYDLPPDIIKSTVAVSGIYDLGPILRSFLKHETDLTKEDATRFSPITLAKSLEKPTQPIVLRLGGDEAEEMKRQSEAFTSVLRDRGCTVDTRTIAHRHHMDIVLDMGDADSELGQLLLTQIHAVARLPGLNMG